MKIDAPKSEATPPEGRHGMIHGSPGVLATLATALLASSLGTGAVLADNFDPAPYRYERPLEAETSGQSGQDGADQLVSAPLDAHLFAETGAAFADLRLVRTRGEESREWPFRIDRLVAPTAPREVRSSATRVISFETRDDGSMAMVLEAAERDFPADRLEISTPLRDFEKTVEVSVSDDGEAWQTLVQSALIVDRQRFVDFRRTAVDLPGSRHRYYRLKIDEASDEQRSALREMTRSFSEVAGAATEERSRLERRDFRIDSVRLLRDPETETESADPAQGERREIPVEILSVEENADERRTEIVISTAGAPIDEIRIASPDRNFRRAVQVQAPLDEGGGGDVDHTEETRWRSAGRGVVHRYAIEGFEEERLALRIEERRGDRLRLLVENLDSPPLRIESVSAAGPAYALRFLAETEPGDRWTLHYGGGPAAARPPEYDLAALSRALGSGASPGEWLLGEPSENPDHLVAAVPGPRWWERPAALYAVIALAVGGLILLLVRAGRGVAGIEEE